MNPRGLVRAIFGPRVPRVEAKRRWPRYAIPTALFIVAAAVLLASYALPYWSMTLHAPQYPKGLTVDAYLNRLTGDVAEIDNLNHYIGMRPLGEAAQLERSLSLIMLFVQATLVLAAIVVHTRWAALLAAPAVLFPAGFLLDLQFWLHSFGQNLDPTAALSSSVKPFTPPVLGEGMVGNFRTVAVVNAGFWMALGASALVIAGLYFHRRAYKPLVDRQTTPRQTRTTGSLTAGLCAAAIATGASASDGSFDLHHALRHAPDGAMIEVPEGVYDGPYVIDRPVRLVARGRAVIDGRGVGHGVHVSAPDVTIRGFVIRNTGADLASEHTAVLVTAPRAVVEDNTIEDALFGVTLKGAPGGVVRGNTISGKDLHIARRGDGVRLWSSDDSIVESNTVRSVRDVVIWYSERVRLIGNHVSDSRYGLHFMFCHDNTLEENRLERNSVGAFLMYSRDIVVRRNSFLHNRGPSGYGVGLKDMESIVLEGNAVVGNRVGVFFDNPPMGAGLRDVIRWNLFAYNDVGLTLQPSVSAMDLHENSFIENMQQVAIRGGGTLSGNQFSRDGRGNYWSDYRGYDGSGDGVGEAPHRVEGLWDSLVDREPTLRLFLYSPAQQAVEFAARAFPVVKPRPILIDESPLMSPPHDVPAPRRLDGARGFALAPVGLFGVACAALLCAAPIRARRDRTPHSNMKALDAS